MQVSYQTPPRTLLEVFKMLPEGTRAELIDNSLYMSPAPTLSHQRIVILLATQLYNLAAKKNLGEVTTGPVDVFLDKENIFQPDVVFVAKENSAILHEDGIHGAPDLVIEILSPGSKKLDLTKKKDAYQKAGIKEYWIVDPETKESIGHQLEKGSYVEFKKEKGKLTSLLLKRSFKF